MAAKLRHKYTRTRRKSRHQKASRYGGRKLGPLWGWGKNGKRRELRKRGKWGRGSDST